MCSHCGSVSSQWFGRCSSCGEYGTLDLIDRWDAKGNKPAEESDIIAIDVDMDGADDETTLRSGVYDDSNDGMRLCDDPEAVAGNFGKEVERVLGGALPRGAMVLIAGDPGVGKSTLCLQIAAILAEKNTVVYASLEETHAQVRNRMRRLGGSRRLGFTGSGSIDSIIRAAEKKNADVLVIDSIQTVTCDDVGGIAGSRSQVSACTHKLATYCKSTNATCIVIGHVTKTGDVAGPKLLEHSVDTVLYFEGSRERRGDAVRVLRAFKNRHGSSDESGVFTMTRSGLVGVAEVSSLFLTGGNAADGTNQRGAFNAVTCTLDGSRAILSEVQALVDGGNGSQSSRGDARAPAIRSFQGVDRNRALMLLAVLSQHLGLDSSSADVYLNVTGGLDLYANRERAADLAVATAVVSARAKRRVRQGIVMIGEIGLGGELREVPKMNLRLSEAARYGFTHAVVPAPRTPNVPSALSSSSSRATTSSSSANVDGSGLELMPCVTLEEALQAALERKSDTVDAADKSSRSTRRAPAGRMASSSPASSSPASSSPL